MTPDEKRQRDRIEETRVDRIKRILSDFGIDIELATWEIHGKLAIYHSALERIASMANIIFDVPIFVRAEREEAVVLVIGHMASKKEWATGEALLGKNYNVSGNQKPHVYAMAEKRGKDRVILKLIELHGDLYSEEEADEFKAQFREDPKIVEVERMIKAAKTPDEVKSIVTVHEAVIDRAPPLAKERLIGLAKARIRELKAQNGAQTQGAQTQASPPPPPAPPSPPPPAPPPPPPLPQNASDREAEDLNAGSFGGPPDDVLNEFKLHLDAARTLPEVVATCDTFRKAIMELLPPDRQKAEAARKDRIRAIKEQAAR